MCGDLQISTAGRETFRPSGTVQAAGALTYTKLNDMFMGLSAHVSIQALRVFVAILDNGSLSAAGREMGVSQPAVSNHLHSLEDQFGVCLLTRGRHARPTPAGASLAEHGRRVLAELSGLEETMSRHAEPRGRLLVGASTTPGELFLPRLAAGFHERYPEVDLSLRVADTDETVTALLEREIEVAVIGRTAGLSRIEERVVEEDELVPIVAAGDPLAGGTVEAGELTGRPFVLREPGSATRRAVEASLAAAGITHRIAMELGSNATVVGAVAAGAGIGVIPSRLLRRGESVERLHIRGLAFVRPFVLLTERGRPLSPAAEAFVDTCTTGNRLPA